MIGEENLKFERNMKDISQGTINNIWKRIMSNLMKIWNL